MYIEWPFIYMVGPKRISIARLFTVLGRCRISAFDSSFAKESKTVGINRVLWSFGRDSKTVLDLSQLISILITGSWSLSFQRGFFVFVFEQN
jgi:hypothetical protein